ncbi:tyrosine-type recombinase/integrase [Azospirillum brasilense]|uniref:tyrosine-type recombinase/integrase n=1 Tax=Azospirillum brasilense TaxID=192 RepID=UPI000E6815AE|nr:tyrosine-type recombinase/integrase [Azospirillum brasilense]NUB24266.1 tyrosine-type recombinase/integrase [Azospirillum brasilense]NUB30124.1 tyrosine-type recombinase/integrase [Azospirillum brasilense]RIW04979.1 hypothetical protein D2T81_09115 [Azospirillum brasilense]
MADPNQMSLFPDIPARMDKFLDEKVIINRAGRPIDVSGAVWKISDPTQPVKLDWGEIKIPSETVLTATIAYMKHLLRNFSVGSAINAWYVLKRLWVSPAFQSACMAGEVIPYRAISEAIEKFEAHQRYRLFWLRHWFNWCCDQGFESFSAEVAFQFNEVVIGGGSKGQAVQSADPEEGPLVDTEIVALNNALRAARMTGVLSLKEQVGLWLCIALGCNSGPLALLREDDFERISAADAEGVVFQIRVPRHKKGDPVERTQFRVRKLTAEIGRLVDLLIAENRENSSQIDGRCGRPLLRREFPRIDIDGDGTLGEYRYHHRTAEITPLVGAAVAKLNVLSPRTGQPLKVTARRLRYTFATRLVREGASPRVLADALDHTDLQHIRVYFDLKSDIVEKLDAAMALELGPVSQAFLGHIVRSESEAERGHRKSSRIYHADKQSRTLEPLGTCGSFSFCGLAAPIACYTCVKFQPWMDAPHDKALKALLQERQRRLDDGQDGKMIALFDNTILAIADVVRRIEFIRQSEAANAS